MLITGFGRFPGAPANPSGTLARALARSRRLGRLAVEFRVLPTAWEEAQAFPALLQRLSPDIVLMLGLAGRRRAICVERIARRASGGFPDVRRRRPAARPVESPVGGQVGGQVESPIKTSAALRRCAADAVDLVHALRAAHAPARVSRDAGRYICNALAYGAYGWARAAEPARRAVFVHIPYPRAGLTGQALLRALEALVLRLVAQHRQAHLNRPHLMAMVASPP
ncbi:pyroglutamyl-peptidase I family protein [Ancylobacter amanitiformis]|uniref:Pyrrolidone-carboxylate peptidase n=1 Tax=Ancylobacter amanitiformis TaxID=217069 RepID=A0ABU0LVK9_9HYPH|nr:peptidase C15 [Ancylobacter amanitiformis]MDQ0512771.1 pyroglutamyl-peptidase [Ancylobacter amanitiformis]